MPVLENPALSGNGPSGRGCGNRGQRHGMHRGCCRRKDEHPAAGRDGEIVELKSTIAILQARLDQLKSRSNNP